MLTVELISTSGRSAGIVARISTGYWMIGRHKECQIRPRTSSVADRHCLLHNTDKVLGIFDLQGEKGTFVNDVQLQAHQWRKLEDGDVIRCGKATFTVAIRNPTAAPNIAKETASSSKKAEVALTASGLNELASASGSEVSADWFSNNINLSDTTDQVVNLDNIAEKAGDSAEEVDIFADDTMVENDSDPTPVEKDRASKIAKKKDKTALKKPKIPKVRKSKSRALPSFSFSFSDPEKLKVVAAVAVTVLFVGFLFFQFMTEFSSTEIRVMNDLD